MTDRRANALSLLTLGLRWLVGAVFLYASLDKLANPAAFAQVIANYRLVPLPLLHVFAWFLPVFEATIGAALILGWQRRGAALLAALTTIAFIVAIGTALARDLDISCGCFHTEGGHGVGRDLLVRDVMLLAAAAVPLLAPRDRWSLDAMLGRDG